MEAEDHIKDQAEEYVTEIYIDRKSGEIQQPTLRSLLNAQISKRIHTNALLTIVLLKCMLTSKTEGSLVPMFSFHSTMQQYMHTSLKLRILHLLYMLLLAGQLGERIMYHPVVQYFHWPHSTDDVCTTVCSCPLCTLNYWINQKPKTASIPSDGPFLSCLHQHTGRLPTPTVETGTS